MANSLQAKKRARQAETHRQRNNSHRSKLRTHVKKVAKAIHASDKEAAGAAYKAAVPVIDSLVNSRMVLRQSQKKWGTNE